MCPKIIIIDATKMFKFTPREEAYLSRIEKALPYHHRIDYFIDRMKEELRVNFIKSMFVTIDVYEEMLEQSDIRAARRSFE